MVWDLEYKLFSSLVQDKRCTLIYYSTVLKYSGRVHVQTPYTGFIQAVYTHKRVVFCGGCSPGVYGYTGLASRDARVLYCLY